VPLRVPWFPVRGRLRAGGRLVSGLTPIAPQIDLQRIGDTAAAARLAWRLANERALAPVTPLRRTYTPLDPLSEAWADFLGRWPWDWFGTHTFRVETHPEAADKVFRVFVSKINRRLYGVRWNKHKRGIRWVRALELQRRGVIHFHTLMGGAGLSELRRLEWMDLWNELAGYARITQPENSDAVRRYCAKYVIKGGEIDMGGPLQRPPPTFFSDDGWY
jgi:hypothetical protein